jgi:hypothetical protein
MLKLNSIEKSMDFALENVIRYGDTDIFPYPIERQVFKNKKKETTQLLKKMYDDFESIITLMPAEHEKLLNAVGYTGFRQGTQIDPIWNVYLLGIVCYIGKDIEQARIGKAKDIVFSYRFSPDKSNFTIFDREYGWLSFQKKSLELYMTSYLIAHRRLMVSFGFAHAIKCFSIATIKKGRLLK